MKEITINRITFGDGVPKICIPVMGKTEEEIFAEVEKLTGLPHQVVEWRADFFENVTDPAACRRVLAGIRYRLPKDLVLFTFRTKKEGGAKDVSTEEYLDICKGIIHDAFADLIDLELFTGYDDGAAFTAAQLTEGILADSPLIPLFEAAHEHGIYCIVSNHDFDKTPAEEILTARFAAMEAIGSDIAKIAVMPRSKKDVLTLLSASEFADRTLDLPVISMSMGKTGVISRLCGSLSGSCLTFGTAGRLSAPGQIPAGQLDEILKLM